MDSKYLSVITGYYGSGKTNFAANLALSMAEQGKEVVVIDLDTVNPYFRTSDLKDLFARHRIQLIAPVFAGTNLDLPALSGRINAVLEQTSETRRVIIDVGGDDAGATPLGTYFEQIRKIDYDMYYLCNFYRMESETAEQTYDILKAIEQQGRLNATCLVGNSNLGEQTTPGAIEQSLAELEKLSEISRLPVAYMCVDRRLSALVDAKYPIFPIRIFGRGGISSNYSD